MKRNKKLSKLCGRKGKDMENDLIRRVSVLKLIEDIKMNPEIPKNYGTLLDIMREVRKIPAIPDLENIIHQLENCKDYTTFRYDKETGVLYEVEADVWARIADGTEVVIPIKSGDIS